MHVDKDVRRIYVNYIYKPEYDSELQQVLLEHRLLVNGQQMRRPRLSKQVSNIDNYGKP